MEPNRSNRPNQRAWDAVSAVILLVALAAVLAILAPAVFRAAAKGAEPAPADKPSMFNAGPAAPCLPPPGICVPVVVTQVADGDTVTVRIVVEARVRLLECWAPETVGGTEASKAKGLASKHHLSHLALGKVGGLYVPFDGAKTLGDVFSFDRILGRVWVDGVGDLSRAQCLSGHAFRTKDEWRQHVK